MPSFEVRYVKEVRRDVTASDRDMAAAAARADGAVLQTVVILDGGVEHEMIGMCEACDGPVWVDQAHRYGGYAGDVDEVRHVDCPAPSSPLDTATTLDERPARGRR